MRMARRASKGTMPSMSTPIVTEGPFDLEPVTADPFVADLDQRRADSRVAAFLERLAASPRRRIYD
jgi:hypothetical protein